MEQFIDEIKKLKDMNKKLNLKKLKHNKKLMELKDKLKKFENMKVVTLKAPKRDE